MVRQLETSGVAVGVKLASQPWLSSVRIPVEIQNANLVNTQLIKSMARWYN